MIKWRKIWLNVLYVGTTLMALVLASGAGHGWD